MIDLRLGDCLDIMRGMEAESVDAVVTDPPYGLSFMGKDWDHGVPGVHFWSEALRIAKPGAYLLAFGGTRTYHRLVCAIEDAGFEIRDTIEWVYGSGFPKSLDVSKAIDKAAGAEREVIGRARGTGKQNPAWNGTAQGRKENSLKPEYDATIPYTDSAREWSGWGTALKPAHEPIVVARKPLSEATIVANVLRWGTGALNIDASRVETGDNLNGGTYSGGFHKGNTYGLSGKDGRKNPSKRLEPDDYIQPAGRFPANLITDGSAEVVAMFPQSKSDGGTGQTTQSIGGRGAYRGGDNRGYFHLGDTGSAARFFKSCPLDEDDYPPLYYCAKASRRERDSGQEDMPIMRRTSNIHMGVRECNVCGSRRNDKIPFDTWPSCGHENWKWVDVTEQGSRGGAARNHHPTVKPLSLMRYLITLCTHESATVLDPFAGSGTTGVACVQLGRNFIGCEIDPQYFEIAKRRIEAAQPVAIELPLMVSA